MARFRKKPIEIEAVQIREATCGPCNDVFDEGPTWLQTARINNVVQVYTPSGELNAKVKVHSAEGTMRAGPTDWLIRGVQGEIYPCKDEIFQETYEPVEDAE